jgi:hypothetical protein
LFCTMIYGKFSVEYVSLPHAPAWELSTQMTYRLVGDRKFTSGVLEGVVL